MFQHLWQNVNGFYHLSIVNTKTNLDLDKKFSACMIHTCLYAIYESDQYFGFLHTSDETWVFQGICGPGVVDCVTEQISIAII